MTVDEKGLAAGIEAALVGGFWTLGLGPHERVGKAHVILPSLQGARLERLLEMISGGRD